MQTDAPTPNEQYRAALMKSKRPKYSNKPQTVNGITYDSQAEARYAALLELKVKAREIASYDFHVKLPLLAPNGALIGHYEVDFLVYLPDGTQEYHDVKAPGTITSLFKWKAKHVLHQYGSPVILIDSKTLQRVSKK